jgi:chemotaxis protein CheX
MLDLAAREVFEIMLGTRLELCEKADRNEGRFTALVGLAGSLCGVLCLRCDEDAARVMAGKMLGMPPEEMNTDSWDALGEVANMIAGNFKGKLSGIGNHCMLSVPTIIVGDDYQTHPLSGGQMLEVIFDFESKPIWVWLELQE